MKKKSFVVTGFLLALLLFAPSALAGPATLDPGGGGGGGKKPPCTSNGQCIQP